MNLFRRAFETSGRVQLTWILLAGAATGCGIWATHFIAMLAYEPGFVVGYDLALTALSLVAAVSVTSAGIAFAVLMQGRWAVAIGGAVVGFGIGCMHYTGILAAEMPAHILWRLELVAASFVFGMALSAAAFVVAVRFAGVRGLVGGATLFTLAIVAHHFTGMGAIGIIPDPLREIDGLTLSPTAIAVAIASLAVAIAGMSFMGARADRKLTTVADQFQQRIRQLSHTQTALLQDADAKLREHHLRLDTALNNMSQGLLMFDAQARLVVCNRRYLDLYGLDDDMAMPGTPLLTLLRHRQKLSAFRGDPEAYVADVRASIAEGRNSNIRTELADGRAIVVVNQPMSGGGWVATHEDVTEQCRAEQRIAYLAHHDTLTGLPNRAAFAERLEVAIAEAGAAQTGFALLCIDLDRLKEVNDVFGHAMGDLLLQESAKRMTRIASGAFVARHGGDEFTIILDGAAKAADAEALAEQLLAAFGTDLDLDGRPIRAGVSIGIALFPDDAADAETLLANADAALYRAKGEGRGVYRFFEASMDVSLRQQRLLLQELRGALENRELTLHYQPQAQINGEILGFEALVRWNHPSRGLVPPATFVPLAEESGMIIEIGEWVLREACREAASWSHPLSIAINLSAVQFQHGDLLATVHSVLLETGLSPSRLELEITESVLIGDFERTIAMLRRLKALGVRIAMDDFGTGYSSLSYLQSFPFDKIKIDRSFISNVERNMQSAAIVRAVFGLAQGLELPVIAEGVETREQIAFLRQEGCDAVQGYFIGRPAPIASYANIVGAANDVERPLAIAG